MHISLSLELSITIIISQIELRFINSQNCLLSCHEKHTEEEDCKAEDGGMLEGSEIKVRPKPQKSNTEQCKKKECDMIV